MDDIAPRSSPVLEPNVLGDPSTIKRELEPYPENSVVQTTAGNDPDEDEPLGVRVEMEDLGERLRSEPGVEALGGGRSPGKIGGTEEDEGAKTHRWHALSREKRNVAASGGPQVRQVERKKRKTTQCEVCGKVFAQSWTLKEHRRVHTGEKPYACTECGKRFSHLGNMKEHLLTHTGVKKHTCDWCGKGFATAGKLKEHGTVHTGEKPFACSECGKKFGGRRGLKTHLLTHTGEKPYTCELCGKGFPLAGRLKVHWRVHTKEKPHGCSQCGKRFSQPAHLQKHLSTHAGEKTETPANCAE